MSPPILPGEVVGEGRPKLRILHLEDEASDAELILAALSAAGFEAEVHRVDTESAFVAALDSGEYEVVLSDYALPQFNGAAALAIVQARQVDIPFIVVSGTLGEEAAVEMLRLGATDYILKDRLTRLSASIRRALAEVNDRLHRRNAEEALRRSEAQLRQSQKMEAIGRLASGVAHDFNNLLTAIMGHAELIRHRPAGDRRIERDVDEILKASESAAALTRQLLTFSRKNSVDRQRVEMNGVVTDMTEMLARLIGNEIELKTSLTADPTFVDVEPNQIEQVLMNLVLNSRDAMPRGGTVHVATTCLDAAGPITARSSCLPPGSYVVLAVADTGCGMSEDVADQIFEPFFTTKAAGRGTGLGLSIVHGIVAQSQGAILVTSVVGRGTSFEVYLPRAVGQCPAFPTAAPAPPAFPAARGQETLLLIEDEEQIRLLAQDALEGAGYTVVPAASRDEALAVLAARGTDLPPVSLVLSDAVMPGLSATAFIDRLRAFPFDGPVVFMSGFLGVTLPPPPPGRSSWPFLAKPFSIDALLGLVRTTLEEAISRAA